MEGDFTSMAGLKLPLQFATQQRQQIADVLGQIALLSPEVQRTLHLPAIDTTSLLESIRIPPIDTTSLLKDMRVPTIDTTSLLESIRIPPIDTTSLLESIRIPPIDLGLKLSGAVDITGLMKSVLTGDDVLRGWERGAFRTETSFPIPGFDEAVRDFATEAAERAEIDLVLPDEPLAYSPQGLRDPLPDQWFQQLSDAVARSVPTVFLTAGEITKAIRYYGALFLFLGLLQGGGALDDGPLPDWVVTVIAVIVAGDTARKIAPRR